MYTNYKLAETLYLWLPTNITQKEKAATFDLDWTLVRPNKGTFPKNPKDNVIIDKRIDILKIYRDLNYNIIIFTNQKLTKKENLDFKLERLSNISTIFLLNNLDIIIFMAIEDDIYRKPNIGMWVDILLW